MIKEIFELFPHFCLKFAFYHCFFTLVKKKQLVFALTEEKKKTFVVFVCCFNIFRHQTCLLFSVIKKKKKNLSFISICWFKKKEKEKPNNILSFRCSDFLKLVFSCTIMIMYPLLILVCYVCRIFVLFFWIHKKFWHCLYVYRLFVHWR